jgi:hypothetical protein
MKKTNKTNATLVEISALFMILRQEKNFLLTKNMHPSQIEINENILNTCFDYVFDPFLLTPIQATDFYDNFRAMYDNHVSQDFWERFERRPEVIDKVEQRYESMRREAAMKDRAETANRLLDIGTPREQILFGVARNDDAWLRGIEAAREANKPS